MRGVRFPWWSGPQQLLSAALPNQEDHCLRSISLSGGRPVVFRDQTNRFCRATPQNRNIFFVTSQYVSSAIFGICTETSEQSVDQDGKSCCALNSPRAFKYFALTSSLYKLKRMSQENLWVMVYFFPQFAHFEPNPSIYQHASSTKIVEQEIANQNVEPIKSLKSTWKENKPKKPNYESKYHQKMLQDSSFQIPAHQESKSSQQKLGRNSVSNILRLFTKLLKTVILKEKYQKMKEKYNFQITLKEFNSWINCIGLNTNKYIRIKKVLNGIRSKPHMGRIVAILYSIFEAQLARLAVLTSSKTEAKNIIPTLAQIRNIKQEINEAIVASLSKTGKNKTNNFN